LAVVWLFDDDRLFADDFELVEREAFALTFDLDDLEDDRVERDARAELLECFPLP
jgi:hypothetical protein